MKVYSSGLHVSFALSGNSPQAQAMCLGDPAKAAPKLGAASSGF